MHIAFKIQKSSERVWHVGKYLKMLDFSKKRDKTSRLLRNTQQISFHMYKSLGIIHVKCYVRMYLVYSPIWIIFFPATFILSDFIHIYFHTVFSEKNKYQIHMYNCVSLSLSLYIYIYIYNLKILELLWSY